MTHKELLELIKQGDSETVEFKQSKLLISTIGKLITAFLNSKGGKIIIGVKENGEILGVDEDIISKYKSFSLRIALKNIKPKATAVFDIIEIENKKVVVIAVPEGRTKPYGYNGTYFKREGELSIEMAQEETLSFFGTQEKYDKRSITEILEKVISIENVLNKRITNRFGTNIFISHGYSPEIRGKFIDFLESLELNPIVVMETASGGLSVDDKVDKLIKKCAASIILYTPDDQLKDGTFLPRQNVIHETGLLQREMPDRIIYVKETSVKLPTNITPKVYVSFEKDNLTDAFIQVIKELKSFDII